MTLVLNERKKLHCVFTCCFYLLYPEVLLSGEISLKVSLKGFPTPVTSALSMPSPQRSDRYEHYVFSGRKRHQSALFLIEQHQIYTVFVLCLVFHDLSDVEIVSRLPFSSLLQSPDFR